MNIFAWRGPEFLLFYLVTAGLTLYAVGFVIRKIENGPVPKLGEPDPYLLAYLRGGADEAIRVAVISLIDRGLLETRGDKVESALDAVSRARRPLERAILREFQDRKPALRALGTQDIKRNANLLRDELERLGLVPNSQQKLMRLLIAAGATLLLWLLAIEKIEIATTRGHHNVGFLILLCFLTPAGALLPLKVPTTSLGKRVLLDFQVLFSRLRARADKIEAGGATNELALVAGIFGLSALSAHSLLDVAALFQFTPSDLKPKSRDKYSGKSQANSSTEIGYNSSSCGSSSGGSSCGGGGSSCGGGGSSGCGGCGS